MPILYSMQEAADALGGISHWTLRKHASAGRVRVVRIGRRVFLPSEEIERIRREGLPSLGTPRAETRLESQEISRNKREQQEK
jgi:hypothetical protein